MDGEMAEEIAKSIQPLRRELERLEEDALFNGEYDAGGAVVTIQSDAGGTDAQDFTEMLLRMYSRWASDRGFKTELVEASPGEEAGLKVRDDDDRGRERVRDPQGRARQASSRPPQPFDQAHRRHTSFAQVIPSPFLPEDANIDIDESDLRIDTYRASGAGAST